MRTGLSRPNPIRGSLLFLAIFALITVCAAAFSIHPAQAVANARLDPFPWVFLRGGLQLQPGEELVSLAAAGDTSLGRGVNPRAAFVNSAGWLGAPDLTLINLECALSELSALPAAPDTRMKPYRLVAPPSAAVELARAGIDIAGLANNHTLDAGPPGLADTVHSLDAAGVAAIGAGSSAADAAAPLIQTIRGLRIAFLAYNAIPSPDPAQPGWTINSWQRDLALTQVRRAAVQADAVVVSLHWGYEYEPHASDIQVSIAQALISAGADLVIGHHPHVAQELLLQNRADGSSGLAAFSLGNFAFDQGADPSGRDTPRHGLALRAFFDRDGLRAVQLLPIQAGPRPQLDAPGAQLPTVIDSRPPWEEVQFSCAGETCQETNQTRAESSPPQNPSNGIFHSGQIDLDGDSLPEDVRLENFRISISSHGKQVWQSLPEWRVLDLALGDADGDGRNEIVLALEKPDDKGVIQSHPFLIGFRGGVYRPVWGGSPVRDPVKEVELADMNGDGQEELLVLEEERGGEGRAVTLWHWHGWGFSLDWRSEYAQFEEMVAKDQYIWVNKLRDFSK